MKVHSTVCSKLVRSSEEEGGGWSGRTRQGDGKEETKDDGGRGAGAGRVTIKASPGPTAEKCIMYGACKTRDIEAGSHKGG